MFKSINILLIERFAWSLFHVAIWNELVVTVGMQTRRGTICSVYKTTAGK